MALAPTSDGLWSEWFRRHCGIAYRVCDAGVAKEVLEPPRIHASVDLAAIVQNLKTLALRILGPPPAQPSFA
jgi:hypothetical protein